MALEFRTTPEPRTISELWARIVRLFGSLVDDTVTIKDVALDASAEGNLVPHAQTCEPKNVVVQLTAASAYAALTSYEIGPTGFVRIWASDACVADVHLEL